MNCVKGDLARVISPGMFGHLNCFCGKRHPRLLVKPDAFVRCVYLNDDGGWEIESPIPYSTSVSCCDMTYSCDVTAIGDSFLRPIRDPGPEAVDEILQLVGAHEGLVGVPG